MYYTVEMSYYTEYFTTYRNAELFCGERGIHPENIYEVDESEVDPEDVRE